MNNYLGYDRCIAGKKSQCMNCDIPIQKGQEHFRGYSSQRSCSNLSDGTKTFHYECYLRLVKKTLPVLEKRIRKLKKGSSKV